MVEEMDEWRGMGGTEQKKKRETERKEYLEVTKRDGGGG
jgi:hypothetical protein